jgi:hypothetical protein
MEPKHTSRLENLVLAPDSASFALDGRQILIKGDGLATARAAFQGLYDSALAEYEARQAPQDRGLLAWLGRLWRKSPADRPSGSSLPSPPASSAEYAPHASFGGPIKPASSEARTAAIPGRPSLESIFADKDGVHVTWRYAQSDGRGAKLTQTVEATFGLDSETARRLESCYDALTKLGYEVTNIAGLAAQSTVAPAALRPEPRSENPAPASAAPSAGSTPSQTPAPKPQSEANQRPQSPPPPVVFRLHLQSGDSSARMLVAPVEDPDHPQVLVAPERLIRALQAGSADSRPASERVTFVRCANGGKGLKVVEIGLGTGPDREPARWQDAVLWWEGAGKLLAKPPPIPAAVPGPAFAAGSSPLQTGAPAEPSVS